MAAPEKIVRCFKASSDGCLYGRDAEIAAIKKFMRSDQQILHITGSPGTGKTCAVKWALKNTRFLYANYFSEASMSSVLRQCQYKVVVIDEFDKYFEERRAECLKGILLLKSKGKRIITISNRPRPGSLAFKPYTSSDIVKVLKEKMDKELGMQVIEDAALLFLSRKFEKAGDLRLVLKAILSAYSKREAHTVSEDYRLRLEDFVERKEAGMEKGTHHELIGKIRDAEPSRRQAYRSYMRECAGMAIMPLSRLDFEMIFDLLGSIG